MNSILSKNEITTVNNELKMKQKMLTTMESKIKEVEGPAAMADQLLEKIKVCHGTPVHNFGYEPILHKKLFS